MEKFKLRLKSGLPCCFQRGQKFSFAGSDRIFIFVYIKYDNVFHPRPLVYYRTLNAGYSYFREVNVNERLIAIYDAA